MSKEYMADQFTEWWGKGKGSEQWARTIEKDILGAIKVAFNAGVSSEKNRIGAMRECPNCNNCIKDLRLENKGMREKLGNAEHDNEIYKWKIEELQGNKVVRIEEARKGEK